MHISQEPCELQNIFLKRNRLLPLSCSQSDRSRTLVSKGYFKRISIETVGFCQCAEVQKYNRCHGFPDYWQNCSTFSNQS